MTPGFGISAANMLWNDGLYNRYASVIGSMHGYPNLLGFIVGDNVATGIGPNDLESGSCVKAAVHGMDTYIRQKNYRIIPVGYIDSVYNNMAPSLAKDAISHYHTCCRQSDTVDFWSLNIMDGLSENPQNICDSLNSGQNKILIPSNYSAPVFTSWYGWTPDIHSFRNFSTVPILFSERISQF